MNVFPRQVWNSRNWNASGEELIFKLLEQISLGEGSVALHSLNQIGDKRQLGFELDFLILTTRALIGLEVKAGRVACKDQMWIVYSTTRPFEESYRKSISPYNQASNSLHKLRSDWMPKALDTQTVSNLAKIPMIPVAVLCENSLPDRDFENPAEMPLNYVIWKEDLVSASAFKNKLNEAVEHYLKNISKAPLDKKYKDTDLQLIVSKLRPEIDLSYPSISALDNIAFQQKSLTEEQYRLVDFLSNIDRLIVDGGAGTGKTFALIYAVHQELEKDRLVGVVTKAPRLREYLKNLFADFNVKIINPSLAIEDGEKVDCLFIDEGQDLCNLQDIAAIEKLLLGGLEKGRWRWFADFENQLAPNINIEADALDLLKSYTTAENSVFPFQRNVRNTPNIVRWLERYCHARVGESTVKGNGPEVQIIEPSEIFSLVNLSQFLHYFGKLEKSEVTILTVSPEYLSSSKAIKLGAAGFKLAAIEEFKGLESRAIVLIGLDDVVSDELLADLLYKGVSRSSSICLIAGDESFMKRIFSWAK